MTALQTLCLILLLTLFWPTKALAQEQTPASSGVSSGPSQNLDPNQDIGADQAGALILQWQARAEGNDVTALYNLGQAYRLGRFVGIDLNKALDFYERAARLGYIPAQLNLASMLYFSEPPLQDKALALSWWQQAAQNGDPQARYMLGVLYFNGEDVPRDYARALAYLQRAHEAGLPEAKQSLRMITPHLSKADQARAKTIYAQIAQIPNNSLASEQIKVENTLISTEAKGVWRVQIGSLPSQAEAEQHWQSLAPLVAKAFGTQQPFYDLSRPGWVRVQIGAFASSAEANAACKQYQRLGKPCLAIKGKPNS
jgi:uncharacterized protein